MTRAKTILVLVAALLVVLLLGGGWLAYGIGMSAIAGSGVGVTVKKSGELVGYEELFSPD